MSLVVAYNNLICKQEREKETQVNTYTCMYGCFTLKCCMYDVKKKQKTKTTTKKNKKFLSAKLQTDDDDGDGDDVILWLVFD